MQRNIDMNEISDGNLYTSNDLVRADCGGCLGCSACCRGMGTSIVLDPYDTQNIQKATGQSMEELLSTCLELHVVDGLILPNMKMAEKTDACVFLNSDGRCSIHALRPGFCRMFPLGRIYDEHSFRYFLQTKECRKSARAKIRIRKWLGIPDLKRYEQFICDWHYLLKDLGRHIETVQDDAYQKQASLFLLKQFYMTPYAPEQFYEEFNTRLHGTRRLFHLS